MGNVDLEEVPAGLNWKLPLLTTAYEFSAKEIVIDFNDLTPKARDNLRLKDLDISIYYKVDPASMAEMMVKYVASFASGDEALLPAFAKNEGGVVVIPANMQGFQMILAPKNLR